MASAQSSKGQYAPGRMAARLSRAIQDVMKPRQVAGGSAGVFQQARGNLDCVPGCYNAPADPQEGDQCVRRSCKWGCFREDPNVDSYCDRRCKNVEGADRNAMCRENCVGRVRRCSLQMDNLQQAEEQYRTGVQQREPTCPCCGSLVQFQQARSTSNCVLDCHNAPADPRDGGRCVRDSCGWGCFPRGQDPYNFCVARCRDVRGSHNGWRRSSICHDNCMDLVRRCD